MALRALADPTRLRLFELVQRDGPLMFDQLRAGIGGDTTMLRAELAQLEAASLIEVEPDDPERWSTPARGIYFEIPEQGGEAQEAARRLSSVMLARAAELPKRWVGEAEPSLSVEWARSAGMFNARVDLTPAELRELQAALERLLEPFTTRGDRPPEAESVRLLAFFMPEAPPAAGVG